MRASELWAGAGLFCISSVAAVTMATAQDKPKIEIVPKLAHAEAVMAVAISPDGLRVASGSEDHTVKLWETSSGQLIRTLYGHTARVNAVAFSPDGLAIFSGSSDKTVRQWDVSSGRVLRTFAPHVADVSSVAVTPDGMRLVTAEGRGGSKDTGVRLWDTATGRVLLNFKGHTDPVNAVAVSPSGAYVLTGSGDVGGCGDKSCSKDHTVRLWDAATGQLLRTLTAHTNAISSVAFSADGTRAISGSKDRTVKLWDVANGQLLRSFDRTPGDVKTSLEQSGVTLPAWITSETKNYDYGMPTYAAMSPDGRLVISISGDEHVIRYWDIASGKLLGVSPPEISVSGTPVFFPDGARILTATLSNSVISLWDAATRNPVRTIESKAGQISQVTVAPDGNRMAVASVFAPLTLWDAASGRLIHSFGEDSNANTVTFSADGNRILTGSSDYQRQFSAAPKMTLKLWDASTGKLLRDLDDTTEHVESVATAPGGALAASYGYSSDRAVSSKSEGAIKLWDLGSGNLIRTIPVKDQYRYDQIVFSPDGTRVLSGGNEVKLWDTATGRLIRHFKAQGSFNGGKYLAFSPDGKKVLVGGGQMLLWDAENGRVLHTFKDIDHAGPVAFSPNGKLMAASANDKLPPGGAHGNLWKSTTVRLWDTASNQLVRKLEGHTDRIESIAFSPDGKRLVSGGLDTTARVWDIATGDTVSTSMASSTGEWLTMTPTGFFTASPQASENLSIVRGLEVTTIDQVWQALFNPDLVRERLANDPDKLFEKASATLNLERVLDSGRPPAVTLPSIGATTTKEELEIEATINDQGGGIGRIEWRVNGLTVAVATPPTNAGRSFKSRQVLALDSGENAIEVVAYNTRNLVSSPPQRVATNWNGGESRAKPKLFALIIGVDDYSGSGLGRLKFAKADAKAIGEALRGSGKADYESVEVTYLLDKEVTASGLENAFETLARTVHPRDTFVFFAAAHGKAENGVFYLMPQDFRFGTNGSVAERGIGQQQLQAWIGNKIKAKRGIVLLDTCESGALVANEPGGRGNTQGQEAAVGKLHEAIGRPVLTASNADQSALEGYKGHGVFTWVVLDALANGDANGNGQIEIGELVAHVQTVTPRISRIVTGFAGSQEQRAALAISTSTSNDGSQSSGGNNSKDFRQKPRSGSRGEDFSLVRRWSAP